MKNTIALLIFLFVADVLHAQHVTVELDKMNTAISADNTQCDQLIIKVNNGTLTGKDCDYIYRPKEPGISKIEVYAQKRKELKKVGEQNIRVTRIPDPAVSINGKTGGYISRQELLTSYGPVCTIQNCDFDIKFIIVSFSMTIVRGLDSSVVFQHHFTNQNAGFDDNTRETFTHLKHNDLVSIDDIKILSPDSMARNMPGLNFKISN